MKIRPSYLMLAGFAFLTVILFFRTTGLHVDENNYLELANRSRSGDSFYGGKPPLFYFINYKFYNEVARWSGPFRPVSIHLFYIAAFAVSLVWALVPLFKDRPAAFAAVFFALLLSPLATLNSTQLMMETAMLPVVSLLFGAALRGGDHYLKWFRFALLSAILVALKVTGAAVVALLAVLMYRRSRASSVALFIGAAAGFLGSKAALIWLVQSQHSDNYGGLSEILNWAAIWDRWKIMTTDLYVWLFFSGIAAIVALGVCVYGRWRSGSAKPSGAERISDGALVTLILGAVVFMMSMQTISIYGFARYNYPTLWLSLIAAVVLIERHRSVALIPLAAAFCLQSSSLWGSTLDRFDLWPSRTVVEFIESGGTIYTGAPIHRLVVGQLMQDAAPCYVLESIHPQEERWYQQYFAFAFPQTVLPSNPQSCRTTIHVWRDPVETVGGCPNRCDKSSRFTGCGYQRLVFFSARSGLALNQMCW